MGALERLLRRFLGQGKREAAVVTVRDRPTMVGHFVEIDLDR